VTAKPPPPAVKPAPLPVTDAQRTVLREVAEEWVRRDAEEPIRPPAGQRGTADEVPVAAMFFERYAEYGEWGVLARFRVPAGGAYFTLAGTPEATAQRRLACVRAIGLLCQEVARLDGEARMARALAGGEVPR
jgi:hypothetical protein